MPDWGALFQRYTDASELGADAARTQETSQAKHATGYASHWWSKAGVRRSVTERKMMVVL